MLFRSFLSAPSDNYRPSYGRRNRDFPRQTVFAATTNDSQYLTDRTGNRRFWPVAVGTVVPANIARDRDSLWAEAVVRYRAGEAWHVNTPEFRALCEAEQAERVVEDPWLEPVSKWLQNPWVTVYDPNDGRSQTYRIDLESGVTTFETLIGALGMKRSEVSRIHTMNAAQTLRSLGFTPGKQAREAGEKVRRYVQTDVTCDAGRDWDGTPVGTGELSGIYRESVGVSSVTTHSPHAHTHTGNLENGGKCFSDGTVGTKDLSPRDDCGKPVPRLFDGVEP